MDCTHNLSNREHNMTMTNDFDSNEKEIMNIINC